ncbi:MAG: 30S ribosomal protein S20 [Spirochaetia bacterium]|nr:30S ribosomal protein S20 [Spirochaetia bacterium]
MAGKGSAEKRQRQSETRRERNRRAKSQVRTATRKFRESITANDKDVAEKDLAQVLKLIDTYAGKGLYHKNTAARKKSRLTAQLNSLS